ncbi:hypothetical protein B0T22DRAFT_239786 [Podospora appendiculata]|uniref:Uncharacterized protein n=1 Tax=Podospora appendiculata TaxID=314037 RepID=A0AAE0X695_9PEZI|nr:hypothetical protein B0T22DRAFT_239786 [Podospora appendiculata]
MTAAAATAAPLQGTQPATHLAEPFDSTPSTGDTTPRPASASAEAKPKKRNIFGFAKKKTTTAEPEAVVKAAPKRTTTASPIHTDRAMPSSPGGRSNNGGLSPRLVSPAGSQIFERDVQESAPILPNSPAIPSHIQTENFIPPVLDASSEAITDTHLDPDSVEIITHTSHQPASVTVTGAVSNSLESSWADELAAFTPGSAGADVSRDPVVAADNASNYGSLDTTDIRRLSFISFADVVQSEQATHGTHAGSRESMHLAGLTSLSSVGLNRSPSPIRSPVSSSGGLSSAGSVKGLELSPGGSSSRKPMGSPTGLHPLATAPNGTGTGTVNGELAIETMTQALRRTGSGDLSGVRSFPTSPI